VERELRLKEKLREKNREYNQLKIKCDQIERNYKRWIEFANNLQARVSCEFFPALKEDHFY